MATSSLHRSHYDRVICPVSNFPNTFNDFFHTLNEDDDVTSTMLEDKLIPHSDTSSESGQTRDQEKIRQYRRGMSCRSYKRRSSEHQQSRRKQNSLPCQNMDMPLPLISPSVSRRSTSLAVTRRSPDLNRFLQMEQSRQRERLHTGSPPRVHLSPNHNPTLTSVTSPIFGNRRLSSGQPPSSRELISPRRAHASNLSEHQRTRSRTTSMPAVPRHRVST